MAQRIPKEEKGEADLADLDKRHLWHPFTQMRDWCAPDHEPLVIESGQGALLFDRDGNEYIDGNASIWTNIHGHNHPALNEALRKQLERIAHCSSLGTTNEPAIRLAAELVALFPGNTLTRVFYSDDGSTAMECALKMATQYWQLQNLPGKRVFIGFSQAYHGDTVGAASLGGIAAFHERFRDFGFPVRRAASLEDLEKMAPPDRDSLAGVVIEPLVQGAAGIRVWPGGMLRRLRQWCDHHGILLILDEVMTGFGRTGTMFACEQEEVVPDFIALAKGLTGGYLPLAATLTTEAVFEAFLGEAEERKTFFHGHSYFGNPLGCSVALASLRLFKTENTLPALQPGIRALDEHLTALRARNSHVAAVRQKGFIAGIDIAREDGTPYSPTEQKGRHICVAARKHGLLTRPILDTIVLIPPLCITPAQLESAVDAVDRAIMEICAT